MNLEQAIARTKAVIGLPELSDEQIGFPSILIEWNEALAEVPCGDGASLPDTAAFALLRDHAQAACDEREWIVCEWDAIPWGHVDWEYDGIFQPKEGWLVGKWEAGNVFRIYGRSDIKLDAMLTALEREKDYYDH